MKLLSEVRGDDGRLDLSALVTRIPYAQFLGVHVEERGNEITLVMPFKESLIGNVMLPALHGGTIGALLEFTAVIQLLAESQPSGLPKTRLRHRIFALWEARAHLRSGDYRQAWAPRRKRAGRGVAKLTEQAHRKWPRAFHAGR